MNIFDIDLSLRLGIIIRRLRQSLGISQKHLANAAGIDQSMISLIEKGKRNTRINLNSLQAIARELKQDSVSTLIAFAEDIGDLETELASTEKLITKMKAKQKN